MEKLVRYLGVSGTVPVAAAVPCFGGTGSRGRYDSKV